MPLISIIILVYNAEKTILETIESVRRQTFSDLEMIVINDGSTDDTLNLIKTIRDDRLKVFSYENEGVSAARNRGIVNAVGEYISFIDADDLWTQDKLERQLHALQRDPESGVAYSWTVIIDEDGKFLFAQDQLYFEGDVFHSLLVDCFIASGSNILVRRACIDAIGMFSPGYDYGEDWDYYLRLAHQWKFTVVPAYQIFYRYSSGGMTSTISEVEKGLWRVIERRSSLFSSNKQTFRKKAIGNVYLNLAFLCLSRSPDRAHVRHAGQYIIDAFCSFPRFILGKRMQCIILLWLLLQFVPATSLRHTSYSLMRFFGRFLLYIRPELRIKSIMERL